MAGLQAGAAVKQEFAALDARCKADGIAVVVALVATGTTARSDSQRAEGEQFRSALERDHGIKAGAFVSLDAQPSAEQVGSCDVALSRPASGRGVPCIRQHAHGKFAIR